MKKIFTHILLVIVAGVLVSVPVWAQSYSGGSGTSGDPYQIADTTDLKYLSEHSTEWGKYFIQTADIYFTSDNFQAGGGFYNSGNGFIPIGNSSTYFTGKYDGNGHIIDSLTMNRTDVDASAPIAMFGVIDGSNTPTITGLGLTHVNITGLGYYVASLVGWVGNTPTSTCSVTDCYATGTITSTAQYTGGFVAACQFGTISVCYSTCTVQGAGATYVGGFAGDVYAYSTVSNCFARGDVGSSTSTYVGGFAGHSTGSIAKCYSTGAVSGSANKYGFLGYVTGGHSETGCFWDTQSSGQSSDAGSATGKTTTEMQTQSTFTGASWDFTSTWQIVSSSYPTLQALPAPGFVISTTGDVSSFGTSTATLNGSANAGGDTAAVRFLYGTTSGTYTDSTAATPDTVTGSNTTSVSASLTGLSSGIKYYYVVAATSSSQYIQGSEKSFTTSSAVWGNDLIFDGSSSYDSTSSVVSTATDNVTIEAWVKWDGTSSGTVQLIASNSSADFDGYGLYLYTDNHIALLVSALEWDESNSTLSAGVWTHLALVRDGGTWALYKNGEAVDIPSTTKNPNTPSHPFFVGGESSGLGHNYYFHGDIDEVRFSNTARYSSNFTAPTGPFTSDGNTVALYHFNEGSGSTAGDFSGNGNDLTLVNSPTWTGSDNPISPPLAVEMASIVATTDAQSATLHWQTATEVNNAGYEIERRNGVNGSLSWSKVGFIDGSGTSNAPHSYSYTDKNVSAGTYSYRLKQIDNNGNFTYSQSVSVTVGGAPLKFELSQNYPNPFNPTTTIEFTLQKDGMTTLKIYNILGQEVATLVNEQLKAGAYHKAIFNAHNLASGIYFARLQSGAQVQLKKLMLLK